MTRELAKQQLARIQAFWPSLPASSQAVDEFARALRGFTDAEVERGVTELIDTHLEPGAPKLGHIIGKVKAQRPRTYGTATEEERDLHFGHQRTTEELRIRDEFAPLEEWLASDAAGRERYEAVMAQLLAGWPTDGVGVGRKTLHRTVLRRVYEERGQPTAPSVKVMR